MSFAGELAKCRPIVSSANPINGLKACNWQKPSQQKHHYIAQKIKKQKNQTT